MRKSRRRRILIPLLILSAGAVFVWLILRLTGSGFTMKPQLPVDTVLTVGQVQGDRDEMIRLLEGIHPFFILEEDRAAYDAAKNRYLEETQEQMTIGGLQERTARFLTVMKDGHTGIRWSETRYLDTQWYYTDRLYLAEGDGVLTDRAVSSIGGVPVAEVFAQIDTFFPAENTTASAYNYTYRARGEQLLAAAGVVLEQGVVSIALEDGTNIEARFMEPSDSSQEEHNTWEKRGDVFIVDYNFCEVNDELKAIAVELEKAVADGVRNVIIDARGNQGGNSQAGDMLLEAMGMKTGRWGIVTRFSSETSKQRGYPLPFGSWTNQPSTKESHANSDVRLAVLTDWYTFSSATMLATDVRDGKLGILIGQPSRNNPSSYGDIIQFQLPNSRLYGVVSHKRFLRPDAAAMDEDTLVPDIVLAPGGQDAMDAALEWLSR